MKQPEQPGQGDADDETELLPPPTKKQKYKKDTVPPPPPPEPFHIVVPDLYLKGVCAGHTGITTAHGEDTLDMIGGGREAAHR